MQIFGNPLVVILSVEAAGSILVIGLWFSVLSLTNSPIIHSGSHGIHIYASVFMALPCTM